MDRPTVKSLPVFGFLGGLLALLAFLASDPDAPLRFSSQEPDVPRNRLGNRRSRASGRLPTPGILEAVTVGPRSPSGGHRHRASAALVRQRRPTREQALPAPAQQREAIRGEP
jgi:hypothetical protein